MAVQPRVMLSLVSDQAIPNVIAALHFREGLQSMVCLVSRDQEDKYAFDHRYNAVYGHLEGILTNPTHGLGIQVCRPGPVNPYDYAAIAQVCEQIIEEYQDQQLIFNVTGGTKVMALAAMQCAQRHSIPVIYVETRDRQIIHLEAKGSWAEPFDEEALKAIDVEAYLAAYGITIRTHRIQEMREQGLSWASGCFPDDRTAEAGRYIASDAAAIELLDRTRKMNKAGKGEDTAVKLKPSPSDLPVLERLQSYGLITSPVMDDGRISFRVYHPYVDWLWGEWLECFVFNEAQKMVDSDGSRFFDECLFDVELDWGQSPHETEISDNQVDVALIRGARLTICECKSGGETFDSDTIYKLEAIARPTGLYCDRVLVTCRMMDWGDKKYLSRLRRACQLGVVVVFQDGLKRLGEILSDPQAELERLRKRVAVWS
jgi:hypothetical protein